MFWKSTITLCVLYLTAGAWPAQVRLPACQQGHDGLGPGGQGPLPRQGVPGVRHEPGPGRQDGRQPRGEVDIAQGVRCARGSIPARGGEQEVNSISDADSVHFDADPDSTTLPLFSQKRRSWSRMKNLVKFRNNILKIVFQKIFIVLAAKVFTSETGFICAFLPSVSGSAFLHSDVSHKKGQDSNLKTSTDKTWMNANKFKP